MQVLGGHFLTLSSTLTRPADTTAYTAGDIIASSTTAGSCVIPTLILPPGLDYAQVLVVRAGKIYTSLGSGFASAQLHIDIFNAAPTLGTGDNGAWVAGTIATGTAAWQGHLTSEINDPLSTFGDGSALELTTGNTFLSGYSTQEIVITRKPGDSLFWTLEAVAGWTPASAQTFTLALDVIAL